MSAFLASQTTYNYIASGLYDAVVRPQCRYQQTVRQFLALDRDSTPEEVDSKIIDAVCRLYDLNRLALVTRYGDPWNRDDDITFPMEIEYAATINPAQLIKSISCVLYQCSEYLADETDTYKRWASLRNGIAYSRFVHTEGYDQAKWDLAA